MKTIFHRLGLAALSLIAAGGYSLGRAEEPRIPVKIQWDYQGVPPGMKLYEILPGDWRTWKTEVVASRAEIPAGREIKSATVWPRPGGDHTKAVLVYQNRTRETVYFFASPHVAEPVEYTLGLKFKCLCTNDVYQVFPGHYWYRVVELWLAQNYAGKYINIRHSLVAVQKEDGSPDSADGATADPTVASRR